MDKNCTIYKTADFVGKKWTLLILLELYKNKKRYSELKKSIPTITPKILSLRLKELEKENMIVKKVDSQTFPIKCEYSLTKGGEEFIDVIQDMKKWALKWKVKNKVCKNSDCSQCKL
jgi:DNA-binding HxlR family transcriptional regulator